MPLADVAIPIRTRQLFTYEIPEALRGRIHPGSRVAVPFGKRKLSAVVVRLHDERALEAKVKPIAGLLDESPLFSTELLAFLCEAADYYLHPLGEVLRAASPALRSESVASLRQSGFLDHAGELPGARVKTKTTLLVRRMPGAAEPKRLGVSQRAILALLAARDEMMLDELHEHVKQPRAALRTLEQHGLIQTEVLAVARDPFFAGATFEELETPTLTSEQNTAIESIHRALEKGQPASFLLHGVTGSGKTEVYLSAIAEARRAGRGALLLVPEIALTPQLVGRFRARLRLLSGGHDDDSIAVLHSALSVKERSEAWTALREGEITLAIGARSAIFAPVANLGLIVVDEEHDPSYKQEEGFRYHARDLAILRAHRANAVCVLGSATPAVESFHLSQLGRHERLEMRSRPAARPLPAVEIVDLSTHGAGPSGDPRLSGPLHRAIEGCLAAGDQAILFLNRRGFAPSVRCEACGEVERCPSCSVALTLHRKAGLLRCHYCDYLTRAEQPCSSCGELAHEALGLGTEKLEDLVASVFAPARVARLDRDTSSRTQLGSVVERVRKREIDILIGTQMVTKGHDLPGVTLVGVILADQSLTFPDFRASERTFQLLTQVAGRAGRGERPGKVLIQTYQPHHPAILAARQHDYGLFIGRELRERDELGYTPFGRLAAIRVDHPDASRAERSAQILAEVAMNHFLVQNGQVEVLGPAPAPIERLRGRFRHRFLLRSRERPKLRRVANTVLARIEEGLGGARASVDIDPVSML